METQKAFVLYSKATFARIKHVCIGNAELMTT